MSLIGILAYCFSEDGHGGRDRGNPSWRRIWPSWSLKRRGFAAAGGRERTSDGPDVFVHYSEIDGYGFRSLEENQHVEFEVTQGPKGPQSDRPQPADAAWRGIGTAAGLLVTAGTTRAGLPCLWGAWSAAYYLSLGRAIPRSRPGLFQYLLALPRR
jgi:cold shock CspA family protein